MSEPDRLTRIELAKRLGVHLNTIDRAVARGEIPAHRIGSRVYFIEAEVDEATRIGADGEVPAVPLNAPARRRRRNPKPGGRFAEIEREHRRKGRK
jgi:excisionase family DNA binding protein